MNAGATRRGRADLRSRRGQGTVEYIGLLLAIGVLLLAVNKGLGNGGAAGIPAKITSSIVTAIDKVVRDGGSPTTRSGGN